jgi:hypothetical protein
MEPSLPQGFEPAKRVREADNRGEALSFLLSGLCSALALLGGCSSLAWADAAPEVASALDAGADVTAGSLPTVRRQVIPTAFLLRDKLSISDDPHLPEATKAQNVCSSLSGIYKVCVSNEGTVDTVDAVQGIPGADAEIAGTLKRWRFKPRSKPACALLIFDFDIPGAGNICDQPRFQPTYWLRQRRLGGDVPHWPAGHSVLAALANRRAVYKLCAGKDGTVTAVNSVVGLPGADNLVIEELRKWRFQSLSFPACTFEFFLIADGEFHSTSSVPDVPPTPRQEAAGQAGSEQARRSKTVPAVLIKKEKISSGDDPHLPDAVKSRNRGKVLLGSYKLCISQDGAISSVDAVSPIQGADEDLVRTLYGWRYKPQPLPICFIQFLEFHIE